MGDEVDTESESDVDMADADAAVDNNARQRAAQQVAQVALAAAVPNPRQHGNNNEHANPGHAPQQQQPPAAARRGAVPGGGAGGGAGAHALPPGAGAADAGVIVGADPDPDPDADADADAIIAPTTHATESGWFPRDAAAGARSALPVSGTVLAVDKAQADQVIYLAGDNPYQQMLVARLFTGLPDGPAAAGVDVNLRQPPQRGQRMGLAAPPNAVTTSTHKGLADGAGVGGTTATPGSTVMQFHAAADGDNGVAKAAVSPSPPPQLTLRPSSPSVELMTGIPKKNGTLRVTPEGARADGYHMNIDTIGTYCLEPGSYEYEAHSNCAVAPVPVTFDHDEEKSTWRVTLPTLSALKDAWTALQSCTELPSKCRFALDAGQKAMVYTLWRDKPGSIHHQHVIITATAP